MFDETFRICFADTPFGVALHQRIRFQVFSKDKGWDFAFQVDDDGETPIPLEADAWDDQSAHFIVQNKASRQWVAATRLVIPNSQGQLPVDGLDAIDRELLPNPSMPLGEISRFCVISNRSTVSSEGAAGPGPNSLESWGVGSVGKQQQFEVTLGMMRAVGIYALKRKIDFCVMMITDAFARLLRTLGVTLTAIGPPTEYLGMRTTYLVDMREAVTSMSRKSSSVRKLFKRSRHAYIRISSVADNELVDTVSEFAPDHSLFNESMFHETVLLPAEEDSDLRSSGTG